MLRQSRLEAGFASSTTVSGRATFPGKSYCWRGQKLVPLAKCTALFRSQTQHLQSSARLLQGSGLHCRRSGFFGDARLRFWDKSGGHPGGTHLIDRRQRSPSYAPSSRYWRASGFRRFRSRVSMHREAESDQDISVEIDSASGDNAGNNHVGQHAPEQEASANSMASWLQFVQKRRFPERLRIVVLCFLAFLINNIDRINLSVAILPMRHEFGWSSTTVGIIQSAFFWGYLLTQLPGGYLADRYGGRSVLAFGVVSWSLMTFVTPMAARSSLPILLGARALLGVGEGVAMPAMNNLVSRWVPNQERSRALSLIYSGMYMGSVIGLLLCPLLMRNLGWQSVFYVFGALGFVWYFLWERFTSGSSPKESKIIDPQELEYLRKQLGRRRNKETVPTTVPARARVPWKLLLSHPATWAIMIGHFCCTWGYFLLLAWLPTYFNQALGFDLNASAFFSILPWLTMFVGANVSGWIADYLLSTRKFTTTAVRKMMQTIGFLGPASFLALVSSTQDPYSAVIYMAAALGLASFSQSGIYSNHGDIGPQYAGILLGMSNTLATVPGIVGVALTGWILDVTAGTWSIVFYTAIFFYLLGTVVYNAFGTGERVF
ncbi:probable Na+-dependent inorganic phosphate cotransporter [Cyanidioschyzon merolae strain 10D]|uniref:Probable Na+-dependent inorganic phosphate cotransporter n=1 Tax=Cyanidioschyzon merolae (strain NIES-3377 / 10D) TaxID=280699 RepID=M1V680_CYAM1|nr:probable Na+-dependent inorganic phosphate cotransporter [Cyanidioschyzon merolae strain 10D]BAM81935.1 probable Na+-dependent inorganic phosphate cotransporter [Cyanidioschyzon merolae strain 10D]|eukprot:XP_005537971.1 probable Na+-dependent inorganic phosphate cotransporter [Cyanidioschyzon merolae strain 10D]